MAPASQQVIIVNLEASQGSTKSILAQLAKGSEVRASVQGRMNCQHTITNVIGYLRTKLRVPETYKFTIHTESHVALNESEPLQSLTSEGKWDIKLYYSLQLYSKQEMKEKESLSRQSTADPSSACPSSDEFMSASQQSTTAHPSPPSRVSAIYDEIQSMATPTWQPATTHATPPLPTVTPSAQSPRKPQVPIAHQLQQSPRQPRVAPPAEVQHQSPRQPQTVPQTAPHPVLQSPRQTRQPRQQQHQPVQTFPVTADTTSYHEPPLRQRGDLSEMDRLEAFYKDMWDREKEFVISMLDRQSKWLIEMNTQLLQTYLDSVTFGHGGNRRSSQGFSDGGSDGEPSKKQRR